MYSARFMWAKIRKRLWQWRGVLIATPGVTAVVLGLRYAGLLQPFELAAFDQYLRSRPAEATDSRIVIVGIREEDVRSAGQWPMSDAMLAQLLENLRQQKPRAIGLDLYRDLPVEPGHARLIKVFESTPNLIGIQKVVGNASGLVVNPPPVLSKLGQVSANDLVVDVDSRVRRNLLSLKDQQGQTIPSLGAALALTYLDGAGVTLESVDADKSQLRLGKAVFTPFQRNDGGYVNADAGGYQLLSNFRNLQRSFRTVSMMDVLHQRIPKDLVRDRIVLIGMTAESIGDFFLTPYSSGLVSQAAIPTSGVMIHADLASQLLSAALEGRTQIKFWAEPWECLWILVWSTIGASLSWMQRYKASFWKPATVGVLAWLPLTTVSTVLLASCLVGGTYLAFLAGWWIPIVPPMLALVGSGIAITSYMAYTAATMRQTFGRYLTDEVVANLLETPEGLKLGGEKRKVTVLVSDLRGFSAMSERVSPEEAVAIINLYLESMTRVMNQYQGTINDFMGDGIFAMFGAPIQREDDAPRAVACAIAMQLAIQEVNGQLKQKDLPALEMGIGIHTGEVLAGNIGSQQRAKYTVMGSNVNLAARIESYTVGGQILISKDTVEEVGKVLQIYREMQVQPKGIRNPITLYEIGGIAGKFNIFLPTEDESLLTLNQPVLLHYTVLEGKQLVGETFQGSIVKLSTSQAELLAEQAIELFSNLQLKLQMGTEESGKLGDIYAKVIAVSPNNAAVLTIRFTSVPPEVAAVLYYLRQSSG